MKWGGGCVMGMYLNKRIFICLYVHCKKSDFAYTLFFSKLYTGNKSLTYLMDSKKRTSLPGK